MDRALFTRCMGFFTKILILPSPPPHDPQLTPGTPSRLCDPGLRLHYGSNQDRPIRQRLGSKTL
jgi:hypothetical protein